VLELV
jgi:hypothetical protein